MALWHFERKPGSLVLVCLCCSIIPYTLRKLTLPTANREKWGHSLLSIQAKPPHFEGPLPSARRGGFASPPLPSAVDALLDARKLHHGHLLDRAGREEGPVPLAEATLRLEVARVEPVEPLRLLRGVAALLG